MRSILCICLIWCAGCNSGKRHFTEKPESIDSTKIQQLTHNQDSSKEVKTKKAVFNNHEPFQIIKSARSITDQSSLKDTSDCEGWTISNKSLAKIIKNSRSTGGPEWDILFDVLPCVIKGQLKQNGNIFDFEVNGGAWFYLKSADTTLIFGDFKKEDEKYFIERSTKE